MRISKWLAVYCVAALGLSGAVMIGCGGGSSDGSPGPGPTPTVPPVASPSPVPANERVTNVFVDNEGSKSISLNEKSPKQQANDGTQYSTVSGAFHGQNFDDGGFSNSAAYTARVESLDGGILGPVSPIHRNEAGYASGFFYIPVSLFPTADAPARQVRVTLLKWGQVVPANEGTNVVTIQYLVAQ
jgi:hypothetical protein